MNHDKNYWIEKLHLQPHPEGGYYAENYRSQLLVTSDSFEQPRAAATSIYYLLDSDTKSFCHRLKCDELWYYHGGSAVSIYMIDAEGNWQVKTVGPNEEDEWAVLIPANTWFGARVMEPNSFVLVSCVVTPGFEFPDLEMADRNEMIEKYPQHKEGIIKYTLL